MILKYCVIEIYYIPLPSHLAKCIEKQSINAKTKTKMRTKIEIQISDKNTGIVIWNKEIKPEYIEDVTRERLNTILNDFCNVNELDINFLMIDIKVVIA